MPRRNNKKADSTSGIRLAQPDRSTPSEATLLDLAEKRGLLNIPPADGEDGSDPLIGRLGESFLWSVSLTMLHFTLDVLAQHQYAIKITWPSLINRSLQMLGVIFCLFYTLHPHPSPPSLVPRVPQRLQQLIFFVGSLAAGMYLIYITNRYSYYAVLKQAPPLGILWIWSVIELDLSWAVLSLLSCSCFMWWGGYSYK